MCQLLWVHMSFVHVDLVSSVSLVFIIPLALVLFLPSLLQGFPGPDGRDLVRTSHLEQRSIFLYIMSDSVCLFLFPSAVEGSSFDGD